MQQAHSRLLVTEHPEPDESLTGYLTRVAGLNGYEEPKWFLSAAGFSKSQIYRARPFFVFSRCSELEGLRKLLELQPTELEALLYPPAEAAGRTVDAHMFYGSPVPRDVIHPELPK